MVVRSGLPPAKTHRQMPPYNPARCHFFNSHVNSDNANFEALRGHHARPIDSINVSKKPLAMHQPGVERSRLAIDAFRIAGSCEPRVELGELAREAFLLHLRELAIVHRVEGDHHADPVTGRSE